VSKGVIPPLLIQAVIAAPLAYAVLRWHAKRWVLILAVTLALLGLAGGAPFYSQDLAHPESGWAFVPSALMVLGMLIALVAGVLAILRRPDALARPLSLSAVALGVLLMVVGVVATLGVEDDARADGDVVVAAKNTEYPPTVKAAPGDVGLYIENRDLLRHTFVIEEAGVKVELPGSTGRHVTVSLKAGTYEFHCDVPGHESMKGTLKIE
jgi:plastocyanin